MCLLRRDKIAQTAKFGLILIVIVAMLVSGCTRLVSGRAKLASPRIGQPVTWGPCRLVNGTVPKLPAGVQCGKVAVPVDYRRPHGDAAVLALIRFPATKKKIGSLIVNPGGPGESGVEAALTLAAEVPPQVREQFDLVGFDPRGVASSRPSIWCNSDAENDHQRTEPQVDYSPKGVAAIERETKAYVGRCFQKLGKAFLENAGTVNVARDLDAIRAAIGDQTDLPRLLLRDTHRLGLRRGLPAQRARDDPRRRGGSQRRPD
jgi:pimeloyl-ACP methyl ester carboxylesterase